MLEKLLGSYIAPEITCHALTSLESDQNNNGGFSGVVGARVDRSSLSGLDGILNLLWGIDGSELFSTLQLLSDRYNITGLSALYRYFHRKSSDELHFLDSLVKKITGKTRHVMFTD